jgi:hypothetical protein
LLPEDEFTWFETLCTVFTHGAMRTHALAEALDHSDEPTVQAAGLEATALSFYQ